MNKFKHLLLMLCLITVFSACEDSDDPTLEVPKELKFEATGGKLTFDIQANGTWEIVSDDQKWYTVNPTNGSGNTTITVTTEAYEDAKGRSATLKIQSGSLFSSIAIVQSSPVPPESPDNQSLKIRARGGEKEIEIPAGYIFEVLISDEVKEWIKVKTQESGKLVLDFGVNSTDSYRNTEVKIQTTDDKELASLKIEQSWRNIEPGELLIEEIYFTGTTTETGRPEKYYGDQYFKLTNNSDELLYADGVMIMESKFSSTSNYEFLEPIIDNYCGVAAVTCVPGKGTDVPLSPGESLLIVNNAQDYLNNVKNADGTITKGNPNSFDLSKANFEWYDESTNNTKDLDNPQVPNMDKWFNSSLSIWILNTGGFNSYAIGLPPATVNKENFLTNYKWEGNYINHLPAGDFQMKISSAYKVPNNWILDAVNCSVQSLLTEHRFHSSLDAGYTYCGEKNINNDVTRFNHSVRRKIDSAKGKLVDTNNSTNDFTPNAIPSLRDKK